MFPKGLRLRLASMDSGSPALRVMDKDGRNRAVLGATTTVDKNTGETKTAESMLTMYDAKGNVIWQAPR